MKDKLQAHIPGVPTPALVISSPGIVVWLFSFTLQPKSPSFTEPFSVRNIFAPVSQQIHLVGERYILKFIKHNHVRSLSETFIRSLLMKVSDRDRNINKVRIIGCVLINFNMKYSLQIIYLP